jgi:DMSO/TMAO reductase YedYZ heme-binding membrane subunit
MRQGAHPWLRWVRWSLFGLLIVLVVGATGGNALDAITRWVQDEYERLPWYVTRISALLAYLALAGSTIYGLLLSTKILDRITHRPVSFTLHQDLAGIGVALALVHAAVLMIDRSVPYSPAEVVIPFMGPYRPLWVGIGQLALGLSLFVLLSFYVRKRIGTKTWRSVHYLSFLAFFGATVHGLMAGSDTSAQWVYGGYLTLAIVVVFLTTYRVVLAIGERREAEIARPSAAGSEPEKKAPRAARPDAAPGSGALPSAGPSAN